MDSGYILYGAPGSGSVAVEAALELVGVDYRIADRAALTDPAVSDALAQVNPMRQLPALVLPSGELMTESAAILIWLADNHPQAGLSPPVDSPRRAAFLRWMAFVSAAIYALFWIIDHPSRVTGDEAQQTLIKSRLEDRLAHCWAIMEAQIEPGAFLIGEDISVLDIYVTVISRWEPGRGRFYEIAPRMGEIVRRVDADARLARLWALRFPFIAGKET
jgi:GST-like protein